MSGLHKDGLGWNARGVFCGECGSDTCEGCQNEYKPWSGLSEEAIEQFAEAKRLLKLAVEDIKDMLPHTDSCDDCALNKDDAHDCSNSTLNCDVKCKWRYADEALKLLGGSENE